MTCSTICDTRRLGLAWFAACWLASSVATAAPTSEDPVAAEALFKAARALVEAGNYSEGCPKFTASLALHASASTALNIAQCHEHAGKLASAWEAYHQALALNRETRGAQRRKGLEALANKGIAALEPRLPRLRIVAEHAPPGLEVVRDGQLLPDGALGESLPADPGEHEVRATAPGHTPETRTVTLTEGNTETVTLELSPAVDTTPIPPPKRKRVPAWAWASGGVGLGLVGVSLYFLVDDLAAIKALRGNCMDVAGGTYCDPDYDFAADNARKNRDLGLFIGLGSAGLVAITAAIVGIARTKSADKKAARTTLASPWLTPGGAGFTVVGRF